MDRELIPLIIPLFAAAIMLWQMLKGDSSKKGEAFGCAIVTFIIVFSYSMTLFYVPITIIFEILLYGAIPAGLIAGLVFFSQIKDKEPVGSSFRGALYAFLGVMFFIFFLIAFNIGIGRDYDENSCHDVGTLGLQTICE